MPSETHVLGIVQEHLWETAGIYRDQVDPDIPLEDLRVTLWEARTTVQKTVDTLGIDFIVPKDFGKRPDDPWEKLKRIDDIVRHVRNACAGEQAVKSARRARETPNRKGPKNLLIISEDEVRVHPLNIDTQEQPQREEMR